MSEGKGWGMEKGEHSNVEKVYSKNVTKRSKNMGLFKHDDTILD